MVKNPFRAESNTITQKNIEEWGKTKFKPVKFEGGGGVNKKRFHKPRGGNEKLFNNKNGIKGRHEFHKHGEKYKFNKKVRDAKPENATPWNKYKDEIVNKQREEEQAALQTDIDSNEARKILKQREINYRKLLMEQKKQEATQWEDFSEDESNTKDKISDNSLKDKTISLSDDMGKDSKESLKKLAKCKGAESNSDTSSKTKKLKNNTSGLKELFPKEILDNFDSKKLNYEQNDKLRRAITKSTIMFYGETIKGSVRQMKMQQKTRNKN